LRLSSFVPIGVAMGVTYFKRFRMEIDLAAPTGGRWREDWISRSLSGGQPLPENYFFLAWDPVLLAAHVDVKHRSFCLELDAHVFPCLAEREGCRRLMWEISHRDGFLPEATWLIAYRPPGRRDAEYCGTVQGIRDRHGWGSVQNLGVIPEHRGRGLGAQLLAAALNGFRQHRLPRASLEVTAQNEGALRLYQRLGFRKTRTVYKAVEVAYA
jgi:ribosomal protein S18 acetylase RimI-like enzyme